MKKLQDSLPHIIQALIVTAGAVVLAVTHIISGEAAVALIGLGNGFPMGVTGASQSISTAASAAVDVSHSASTQARETAIHSVPATTQTDTTTSFPAGNAQT